VRITGVLHIVDDERGHDVFVNFVALISSPAVRARAVGQASTVSAVELYAGILWRQDHEAQRPDAAAQP